MKMLTAERLRELLDYDPETGVFRWRVRASYNTIVGGVAGYMCRGYIKIAVDSKKYSAHRLAFLWVTGVMPLSQVDHVDCDRANNAWSNLREATKSQNRGNTKPHIDSASGIKGVWFSPHHRKWRAECRGKKLGTFLTKQEAALAYQKAALVAFGEFARF